MPQLIPVAFATGTRYVPLTKETMETMSKYFERKEDGVFYFSEKKQRAAFKSINK